jgi:hypothetical protein
VNVRSDDLFTNMLVRSQVLFANSILQSTQDSYLVGWKQWLKWSDLICMSPVLASNETCFTLGPQFSYKLSCFLAFLTYLAEFKRLHPGTICSYINGVRYYLARSNVDTTELDASIYWKKCRLGVANLFRVRAPIADVKKLPLSCDMFLYGVKHVFNSHSPLHHCIIAALAGARTYMFRASETCFGCKSDHFLLSQHVEFECLINGFVSFVNSHNVLDVNVVDVVGVIIFVRSAKNDSHGAGHKIPSSRNVSSGYDVCSILFNWAKEALLKSGDPFFSYRQGWYLSYSQFNQAHKAIAKAMELPVSRFSCKSSRIGGACALSLAGFPDSFIMQMGRWKSLAFLHYVRQCITAYSNGVDAISDPLVFTLNDVRRLLPVNLSYSKAIPKRS